MDAYWDIYETYYERVRRFIFLMVKDMWVAEDLLQETFVKVQKNLTQLNDSQKTSSWIFRIAFNICQDHFRNSNRKVQHENSFQLAEIFPHPLSSHNLLEQQEMSRCVQEQTKLLPESLRTPLLMFDMMGFSHREIADILDISLENTKVRLHRARKQLKVILKNKCHLEIDERNILVCEPRQKE